MRASFVVGWLFSLLIVGCVSSTLGINFTFGGRNLIIQTYDLFNQRLSPNQSNENWNGDWIFRRERLQNFDSAFRSNKSNIVFFQGIMEKRGDPNESDVSILSSGGLSEYTWILGEYEFYEDTWEQEYLAIAISYPISVIGSEKGVFQERKRVIKVEPIKREGFAILSEKINHNDQPVLLVNVKLDPKFRKDKKVYDALFKEIKKLILESPCNNRVVLGGYLPGISESANFENFLSEIQYKSTNSLFCESKTSCFTTSSSNYFVSGIAADLKDEISDLIIVHGTSFVSRAARNFNDEFSSSDYSKIYGLNKLNPSYKYGWQASVDLPNCAK